MGAVFKFGDQHSLFFWRLISACGFWILALLNKY